MQPRTRKAPPPPEPEFEPPELDDDGDPDALREATMLLGVPEWVDPETGELADDELTRLEDH